jgi:hypothetical protein
MVVPVVTVIKQSVAQPSQHAWYGMTTKGCSVQRNSTRHMLR